MNYFYIYYNLSKTKETKEISKFAFNFLCILSENQKTLFRRNLYENAGKFIILSVRKI